MSKFPSINDIGATPRQRLCGTLSREPYSVWHLASQWVLIVDSLLAQAEQSLIEAQLKRGTRQLRRASFYADSKVAGEADHFGGSSLWNTAGIRKDCRVLPTTKYEQEYGPSLAKAHC